MPGRWHAAVHRRSRWLTAIAGTAAARMAETLEAPRRLGAGRETEHRRTTARRTMARAIRRRDRPRMADSQDVGGHRQCAGDRRHRRSLARGRRLVHVAVDRRALDAWRLRSRTPAALDLPGRV